MKVKTCTCCYYDRLDETRKMAIVHDLTGNWDKVAVVFGCSARTCRRRVKDLYVAPAVQEAIRAGKVHYTESIMRLAGLPKDEQLTGLDAMLKEHE